ncbi:ATP-binding protein [Streptomyces wuyuanensis]|uniref:ATP-dependent DNA helicase RecG n=1 Tax=Streptomyces wuyuanensis TaxID=1196353 RepID=A0A1G9V1G8_9ACTN|nr:ATP-binding protein [Streptomyces wuyuanensis]SDM65836.1 ATP-dependent DNA helicase RecG [Streptomyces wuyuanensis]
MSIQVVHVTANDVAKILDLDEAHFSDLKSVDIAPGKLTKTIAAFANADGGELYIGIDEIDKGKRLRRWRGFPGVEEANGHIQAFEGLFPLGQDFSYEFLQAPESSPGLVLHVTVQKTRAVVQASDGKVYVRRGAQSIPYVLPSDLDRLSRNKGITSFEAQTVLAPLEAVSNSETIIGFMLAVTPSAEPLPWLKKQLLIHDGKPTVAALLLFSDEPQAALPKRSAIKIYRYKTAESQGTRETLDFDPVTVEGCLYDQIRASVQRTSDIIEQVRVLGPEGLESITYPHVTLHEIITNAVLHRDYGIADDVHVRVFDNRVEVESPGRLPAHITEKNILDERFARNGTIVRLINKFPDPPNKDVGEGLNTAFSAMKKLKLRDPVIRQAENSVIVEIRHQKLGTPEELIMEWLDSHEEITNKRVRELTGIGSENEVKRIFYRLAEAKQIERVPGKGGGSAAWQKFTGNDGSEEPSSPPEEDPGLF